MFTALQTWFHMSAAGEFVLTALVSMLPVLEIRGGIPFGTALGLGIEEAFLASLVGNMLPVPFIILFVRKIFAFLRRHFVRLGAWVDKLEKRAWEKSQRVQQYQMWGLFLLVAIPLPGTGAWTGALIAALLDMRLRRAVPVILAGVVTAGLIVSLITVGAFGIFA